MTLFNVGNSLSTRFGTKPSSTQVKQRKRLIYTGELSEGTALQEKKAGGVSIQRHQS